MPIVMDMDATTENDVYGLRIGTHGLVDENTSSGHDDNLHALPGCTMGDQSILMIKI